MSLPKITNSCEYHIDHDDAPLFEHTHIEGCNECTPGYFITVEQLAKVREALKEINRQVNMLPWLHDMHLCQIEAKSREALEIVGEE